MAPEKTLIAQALQAGLQDAVAKALNLELYKDGRLVRASPRRAKRVIATAAAAFIADRIEVTIDEASQRIDVRWPTT